MADVSKTERNLIEGRSALIVIDIQKSTFIDDSEVRAIDNMPGYRERMAKARAAIDKAHDCGIPVIFIQEIHRQDLVDFGRELDGNEDVHCLEDDEKTEEEVAAREGAVFTLGLVDDRDMRLDPSLFHQPAHHLSSTIGAVAGEMNFGTTSLAAPKAASSSVER